MSYTRDSSKDLVWNENSNSYVSESAEPTTIAEAIAAAQQRVAAVYTAISNKGGTLPATQNLSNLPTAIDSIPSGGTTETSYGNYYIMQDDSLYPVYFDAVTINGASKHSIIMTDAVTNMDNTSRGCSIYLISCSGVDISQTSFSFQNITNVTLSTEGLSALGIKKIVYKSVTGRFYASYQGILNVTDTSASTLKTIDISNATSIYLRGACIGLTALEEVKMDKAENVTITRNSAAIGGTFKNTSITELKFPALKTTSEINIQYMLSNLDGCTVHFPSNLQTTIASLDGYPNFGGTNTILLFDLPATETNEQSGVITEPGGGDIDSDPVIPTRP